MNSNRPFLSLAFAICLVFGVVLAVQAAGDGPPTRTIPFQGSLELDGAQADGPYNMVVTLFDDAIADNELFNEPHTVTVNGGKFSLVIGSNSTIPDAALNAAELFAEVSVEGVALAGRQKIHAASRVMDPPEFRTGRLVTDSVETGTIQSETLTVTPTSFGLSGWRLAADIEGPNGAIRLNEGNVQLGLHNSGSVFISDTTGVNIAHPFEFQRNGDMVSRGIVRAEGLDLGSMPTPITRIDTGFIGNCGGGAALTTSSVTTNFPGPDFSSPPIMMVTAAEYDDAGCTDVRLTNVTEAGFTTRSYTGNNVGFACGCIHWIAIGK